MRFFCLNFQKLPQKLLIKDMAPAPTEGMTTSSMIQQGVPTKTAESFPVSVVPPDHNDNYVTVNGEDLFTLPPVDGEIYTSVDQQFLELMLDAVQKGFMPPELATAKTWLNNDSATEVDLNGSAPSPVTDINGENDEEIEGILVDAFDDQGPPSLASTEPISLANGASHPNLGPPRVDSDSSLANSEPESVDSHQSPASVETTSTAEDQTVASAETMCGDDLQSSSNTGASLPVHVPENDNGVISDSEQSAISTPSKKVQFLGLDTVFGEQEKAAEGPLDISISPSHSTLDSLVTETGEGLPSMQSSPKTTVTWATLDSPVKTTRLMENDRAKSPSRSTEGHCGFETALYDTEADEKHEGDLDDPFMVYLNSIEQTALKFKLQVEQAKVDTLETLKEKLERAYEGTPLEDIPVRFQEKLQDTIAQIASDEVLKKYQALVSQDEEMAEEENAILECMRNELDSVASENFALHQQLELLKDYETRYYDLKEKFDSLSDGMATIRNEYEKKNGESEFLAERVESLEKSIVNLRVEYDNEISDLQNENLQLQKSCFELENRNKILEEEIAAFNEGSDDSRTEDNVKEHLRSLKQKLVPKQELEVLELRLEESERQNSALRAAAQADQAMIRCVEDKKGELERSLVKAQDDNSKVLLELHEAQRQISSDRVKLSSYQEEVDALQRENKLLKSSLEIAQNELEYHMEKKDEKSEPWKSNKRMIWREIRELEKILKDVHKEKRNLEKKYVTFKQENDQLNNSLSLHSYSSAENSPEREEEKDERDRLKSKSWHSATEVENNKINAMNSDRDDDSFSSPPRKVKSWLDGLNTPNGVVKKDDSFDLGTKERTPVLSNRFVSFLV